MSTIPLSMREGHGQTLSGGAAPPIIAPDDDDGGLDELIAHVTETVTSRGRASDPSDEPLLDAATVGEDGGSSRDDAPDDSWRALKAKLDDPDTAAERGPETALDSALKREVDRRAGQETESADFHSSREWRDTLHKRYDGRIAIGDLLETFADWHDKLKADPSAASAAIASAYLVQPQYTLPTAIGAPRPPATAGDATPGQAAPGQTLNRVLAAAIDKHHGQGNGEQAAFAASARHRAALKEMFPGMTYAEACRRVVMLDGDLHRDPLATAARLAASYGTPGASAQPTVAGDRETPVRAALADNALRDDGLVSGAQQIIAATASHLPDLEHMQDDVAAVLERPEFMHGPDMQQNLLRAHRVAQLMRQAQSHRHSAPASAARLDGLIAQAMQGA